MTGLHFRICLTPHFNTRILDQHNRSRCAIKEMLVSNRFTCCSGSRRVVWRVSQDSHVAALRGLTLFRKTMLAAGFGFFWGSLNIALLADTPIEFVEKVSQMFDSVDLRRQFAGRAFDWFWNVIQPNLSRANSR